MAYLSQSELESMGFKSVGKNVKISDKASIYEAEKMDIGSNIRIDDFCVISGKVSIGDYVHIAVFNNVAGGEPGIEFHDFAGLAYGCHVFAQSDDYTGASLTNPCVPDEYKTELKSPIVIGRHVIVGTNSTIMPGVTLEEGCAVGAYSMVLKSTDPWGIYVGVPAKRIKDRKKDLLDLEAQLRSDVQCD